MAGVAGGGGGNDFQWCFSQVKGAIDEDVAEAKAQNLHSPRSKSVREIKMRRKEEMVKTKNRY